MSRNKNHRTVRGATCLALIALCSCATTTTLQDTKTTPLAGGSEKTADELAKELSNPTAALATLNANFSHQSFEGDLPGADSQDSFSVVFQPTFPFPQGDGYNVLFRPALPILFNQPVFDSASGDFDEQDLNLGDMGFDLAYGTTTKSGTLMLAGVVGTIPTATDDALGRDLWNLGPELMVGMLREWGVVGALVSHQWDVAGGGDGHTNLTGGQYFYALSLHDGWQIASGPTWSYNHEVSSDEALTLPLGVGVARTAILGGRAWKFSLEYWHYLESPDSFGLDSEIRFKIGPVVQMPWTK